PHARRLLSSPHAKVPSRIPPKYPDPSWKHSKFSRIRFRLPPDFPTTSARGRATPTHLYPVAHARSAVPQCAKRMPSLLHRNTGEPVFASQVWPPVPPPPHLMRVFRSLGTQPGAAPNTSLAVAENL